MSPPMTSIKDRIIIQIYERNIGRQNEKLADIPLVARRALATLTTPAPGRDALRERIKAAVTKHCHVNMKWPATAQIDDMHVDDFVAEILSALPVASVVDEAAPVVVVHYTNWRGETSRRRIIPKSVRYGSTEWHPEPQWLLLAWDDDKQADREFALKDFGARAGGGER